MGRLSVSGDGVEGKQAEGRVEATKHGMPGRVSSYPFRLSCKLDMG